MNFSSPLFYSTSNNFQTPTPYKKLESILKSKIFVKNEVDKLVKQGFQHPII